MSERTGDGHLDGDGAVSSSGGEVAAEGEIARGARTLIDVLNTASEQGFGETMMAAEGGEIRCEACGGRHDAHTLVVDDHHRLEGASDPADMLIVVLIRCPTTRLGATLTLGFGPNASRADADVLSRLRI
jgi:hypothetical protein